MEFHISRRARESYEFDESLFSLSGNVIFANFRAAREFAHKMNQKRDAVNFPERGVRAGQVNAMGLIDEIMHFVMGLYREQRNREVMRQALVWLEARLGREVVDGVLRTFADEFPPLAVYRGEIGLEEYLGGQSEGVSNREILLEELMALWLENVNPAFSPFMELFDDTVLQQRGAYQAVLTNLQDFFATQPSFGPDAERLLALLQRPAREVPYSLSGQLEWILKRWGYMLGKYLGRLLGSLDLIREEEKAIFVGPGPAQVYDFSWLEQEQERFTPDKEWMPRLVLMAKNAYVWLSQLSQRYRRPIATLGQIPDEELDTLARWGITGLWLIGVWERSAASQRIKQIMGNPEAVASAYSLMGYQVAGDLGGEGALNNLRERAWQRGIRLASDMVPNHMGIDSHWVMQHPDWFIQLEYSPFPSYSFHGPDLSWSQGTGILLEDHYYSHSDAAVVFKHVDRASGRERYIYHGNDGTSMPWNDTAQLNYLLPDVREAVIQTILHVARQFPVIRFDAAMTLAKKHYQRLWFPEPGSGGDIPSRAELGMYRADFDAAMPQEFWREVVDRMALEAPDTLLLAEAFWMMEGYFVRTLGMHRVYNSAFMNMLRDELNAQYRQLMKNTLEFDPQILKRYVNFMNNPDERTAVDQFGKGDKYFGVCTLMATLPGLPMFGHGQVEGYAEKYGMEFRRAYWDEHPDAGLVERHEREIFPLLHRRHVFAGVEAFVLYDFYTPDGHVNEDVFAYSNRAGTERGLVIYHNRYADVRGWVRTSAAYLEKGGAGGKRLVQKGLADGLDLRGEDDAYCIFRDQANGLEYIRHSKTMVEQGLYVELQEYQRHVFVDFRDVADDAHKSYRRLAAMLNGRGVPSIEQARQELMLEPVRAPYRELVNAELFRRLAAARITSPRGVPDAGLLEDIERRAHHLLGAAKDFSSGDADVQALASEVRRELEVTLYLPVLETRLPRRGADEALEAAEYLWAGLGDDPAAWGTLFGWVFTRSLGRVAGERNAVERTRSWIDEWRLGDLLAGTLQGLGLDEGAAWHRVDLVKALLGCRAWLEERKAAPADGQVRRVLETWLANGHVRRFLQVNRYEGVDWFNHESFHQLLWWVLAVAAIETCATADARPATLARRLAGRYALVRALRHAEAESRYQVERLLKAAGGIGRGNGRELGNQEERSLPRRSR
jgi:glycosidase